MVLRATVLSYSEEDSASCFSLMSEATVLTVGQLQMSVSDSELQNATEFTEAQSLCSGAPHRI
jgi:hypothetical protein